MRKLFLTCATLAALAAAPSVANAQANTFTGAAVGAGTGALIAGPPGAVVGGIIGGTMGATTEPRTYVEPGYRTYGPRYRYAERVCWLDDWGRRQCRWR